MSLSYWKAWREKVNQNLNQTLPSVETPPYFLHEAMHYCVLPGGKRLRGGLVYATGESLNADLSALDRAACAVELIHTYSLVHDDLPMMDNDDLRRGKPTCHKAFDEATALLVGDALQALAFRLLSQPAEGVISPSMQLKMIALLAEAMGSEGMVGGQAYDISSTGQAIDFDRLQTMHRLKTGALIRTSVLLGAYAAGCEEDFILKSLRAYGDCVGLAFQISDDLIDIESSTETLGKMQGADQKMKKPTYPALLGIEKAREKMKDCILQAVSHLENVNFNTAHLENLAFYIIERKN